ncbi:hypothetical protein [Pseudopelagicola sp. nBUS_19]|uniref:hypothetical protein n=1 Tax=unclassified Pseudopelagicola TaxID=2649563 RepID=UPI003EBB4885
MARKRHLDKDVLKLLRAIELKLSGGSDVESACCGVGITDVTFVIANHSRFPGEVYR